MEKTCSLEELNEYHFAMRQGYKAREYNLRLRVDEKGGTMKLRIIEGGVCEIKGEGASEAKEVFVWPKRKAGEVE